MFAAPDHTRTRGCVERLVLAHRGTPAQAEMLFVFLVAHWGHVPTELRERVMALSVLFQKHSQNPTLIYELYFEDEGGLEELVTLALRGGGDVRAKRPRDEEPLPPLQDVVDQVLDDSKMELFGFQKAAVRCFERQRGLGVFFATGNGKTATAIACAQVEIRKNPELKVVVVAPKSLLENFQIGMDKFGVLRNDPHYDFYTFESFVNVALERPQILRGALLIVDEAHHLRTSVYPNLRAKLNKRGKAYKAARDPTPEQRAFLDKYKAISDVLTHCLRQDFSWPLDEVFRQTGVDLGDLAPRSLRMLMAAREAYKVLLLSATPVYNDSYDIANLTSLVRGQGVMSKRHFKTLLRDRAAFHRTFQGLFVWKDIAPNDPDFPRLEVEKVLVPMTAEYYEKYHNIELENSADWERPWAFLGGVRQATLGLPSNPKCSYVKERLEADHATPTMIHSAFITRGLRHMQKQIDEEKIPYVEITGDTPVDERAAAVASLNAQEVSTLFVSCAGSEGTIQLGVRLTLSRIGYQGAATHVFTGDQMEFARHVADDWPWTTSIVACTFASGAARASCVSNDSG